MYCTLNTIAVRLCTQSSIVRKTCMYVIRYICIHVYIYVCRYIYTYKKKKKKLCSLPENVRAYLHPWYRKAGETRDRFLISRSVLLINSA